MKASRFSESQSAYVLRQAEDGTAIGEVCRSAGISEATLYNWRKKYDRSRKDLTHPARRYAKLLRFRLQLVNQVQLGSIFQLKT